jgi:hypothetical protein
LLRIQACISLSTCGWNKELTGKTEEGELASYKMTSVATLQNYEHDPGRTSRNLNSLLDSCPLLFLSLVTAHRLPSDVCHRRCSLRHHANREDGVRHHRESQDANHRRCIKGCVPPGPRFRDNAPSKCFTYSTPSLRVNAADIFAAKAHLGRRRAFVSSPATTRDGLVRRVGQGVVAW